MNVWRGFSLVLWIVGLTVSLCFALLYQSFAHSTLDGGAVKQSLAKSSFYATLRDTVMVDQLTGAIAENYPANRLIDRGLIRTAVADALPAQEVRTRVEPGLSGLYAWLDSKEPSFAYTVSFEDKRDTLYQSLEAALNKKIATLPSCGDNRYPPEAAVLNDLCLPPYVTAREATQAIMGAVRAERLPLETTITERSLVGTASPGASLPSYLNLAWTLSWLAIVLFAVLAALVVVRRKSLGFIALGASVVLAALLAGIIGIVIERITRPTDASSLSAVLVDAIAIPFVAANTLSSVVTFAIGVTTILIAVIWRHRKTGRRHG